MGSQGVGHDWATDLIWSDAFHLLSCYHLSQQIEYSSLCYTGPCCLSILSKLIQPLRKMVWRFLKKLGIKPPSVQFSSVQFSRSVMSNSLRPHEWHHARPPCLSPTPGVHQTHMHWVSDAIQPSHPLSFPSPLAPNPSQHQSLFQWVNSLHEVSKVLEFQL